MPNEDEYFITTKDNMYDPFKDFMLWLSEDRFLGHNTCSLIDQFAQTSEVFSDSMNNKIIYDACKHIVELDILNNYIIVTPKDYKNGKLIKKFDE